MKTILGGQECYMLKQNLELLYSSHKYGLVEISLKVSLDV